QVVPITIIDDAIVEGLDSIMLQLSSPTNGATIFASAKKIYIKDNDTAVVTSVSFNNSSVTKAESDGLVNIGLTINNPINQIISLPFTISGTCTANSDDTIFTSTPINIPANATTANIQVNIIDDALLESTETVVITLGTPTNASLGTNKTFTISITDNDANGFSSLSNSNKISIYPNPTNAALIVSSKVQINNIEIRNILGQKQNVFAEKQAANDVRLITENLPSGIYFIKVIDEKGIIFNSKFTKQ
ncbi:MAG: hypothetical protein RL065_22, partial [Bacteroidota bacterium]